MFLLTNFVILHKEEFLTKRWKETKFILIQLISIFLKSFLIWYLIFMKINQLSWMEILIGFAGNK